MITNIIKNSLLLFLIVLIFHFMIKNQILEDVELLKRKQVHEQTLSSPTSISKQHKKVRFANDDVVKEENEISEQYVKECSNSLTCDDMTLPEGVSQKHNHMQELYDFVYDKEQNINSYFPEKVTETLYDETELDQHIQDKKTEFKQEEDLSCNFEVIGIIEHSNEIDGLDTTSSGFLSKLI